MNVENGNIEKKITYPRPKIVREASRPTSTLPP